MALVAVAGSLGAGAALGLHQARTPADQAASGDFVRWVEDEVEGTVETVTAAAADRQLRRHGLDMLGGNASLSGVPFESLSLHLSRSSGPTADDVSAGVFRARALLEYQLKVDDVRVGRQAAAVFRLEGGSWRLVRVAPSGLDLWDHEAVRSIHTGRVLVLGREGDQRLAGLSRTAAAARADVDRFWTSRWPGTAVVVLPSDAQLLNPLLGVRRIGDDQVAVTRWETGRDGPVIRVLLNPSFYDQMSPLSREIVLRHEITHVAQDALPRAGVPTWLTEGLAEYVGYRGSGVPSDVIGARLFSEVRAGETPGALPADSDFGFGRSQAERRLAYESGWSFQMMLADRYGEDTLVPFYTRVSTGDGTTEQRLRRAASRVVGVQFERLVEDWQDWLEGHA